MNKISFDWNIILECNYRCQYCWFCGKWQEMGRYNRIPSFEQIIKTWQRIYDKYGSVHIDISGGEPFLFPRFAELIKELSTMHSIDIATNLSCDVNAFVDEIDPRRVGIIPTFHPAFADYQKFLKRALLLKENNFGNSVYYLAYPLHIPLLASYKEKFNSEGLELLILPFLGKCSGIDYPAGYTAEEKQIIESALCERDGKKYAVVPEKAKGRLCRAGHTSAVIFPDGTTLRCSGKALSSDVYFLNFFDEKFKLLDKPLPCDLEYCLCNEGTFLLTKEKDEIHKRMSLQRETTPPYRVFFSWYLNNECNYKCSYCKPQDIKTAFISVNRWVDIWDDIYAKYGSCHIHISGGEPFIYPDFIKLITRISKKHTLEFSTNLSQDIRPFINNIGPDRARLGGSFHPEFANFDEFLRKILLLKNSGYEVWTNYVAYPPDLKDMARYKKRVGEHDIRFSIQPFNGRFEGREYPQNYTEDEKRLMTSENNDNVNKETIDWRTDGKKSSIKGSLCRMGQMYARIYPDAEAYRCCGNGALRLGNLIDKTFKLLEEAQACECDNCPCWKCMLTNKEDYWVTYWAVPNRANLKGHEKHE